jgi:DNA-binding NarL/FixJ family response regulator
MPAMDGIDATREITADDLSPAVVMLTGSDSAADVTRAREAGASAYLTKDQIAEDLVRDPERGVALATLPACSRSSRSSTCSSRPASSASS